MEKALIIVNGTSSLLSFPYPHQIALFFRRKGPVPLENYCDNTESSSRSNTTNSSEGSWLLMGKLIEGKNSSPKALLEASRFIGRARMAKFLPQMWIERSFIPCSGISKNARFIPSPREEITVRTACRTQQKIGDVKEGIIVPLYSQHICISLSHSAI